jgi:putative nucleotidyltransferase with HDIG domain
MADYSLKDLVDTALGWARNQPWASQMAVCQQDAQWHAEGDVWTHTLMVCEQLEKLEDWPTLTREEQLVLLFTGLLHDAGKPATTLVEPETGRIRSPKHSLAGSEIARRVLRELACDLETRESIARLVRYHGRPPYLLEKENPECEVLSLSWLVSNRLLYLFALADTRGRQAAEMSRPEDNLHLWKLLAQEQGCFDSPYAFANDQARFLFYRNQLNSLHYVPHEDYRCRVILMSGLPGAGKDTWLERSQPGLPMVSLDEIRSGLDVEPTDNQGEVVQAAREQCREHLRAGRDFAFNATNLTFPMRQRWIGLFADYAARIEIVYLEPPLRIILEQNRQRVCRVPENVMQRLVDKTEPPTITEAHALQMRDI